jgi:hypothetical protein
MSEIIAIPSFSIVSVEKGNIPPPQNAVKPTQDKCNICPIAMNGKRLNLTGRLCDRSEIATRKA